MMNNDYFDYFVDDCEHDLITMMIMTMLKGVYLMMMTIYIYYDECLFVCVSQKMITSFTGLWITKWNRNIGVDIYRNIEIKKYENMKI